MIKNGYYYFEFDIELDVDVLRSIIYVVYISQHIRFDRVCRHMTGLNARNIYSSPKV